MIFVAKRDGGVEGFKVVRIQPSDSFVPVSLKLNPASASTANDGSIPYGSTLVSATVATYDISGKLTTSLIERTTESGNTVIAYLSYSTALSNGLYKLTYTCEISLGRSRNMSVSGFMWETYDPGTGLSRK